jgi:RNA-directed DNA polymerase
VTYADDLVILCRKGKAEEALHRLREIMGKLKLTVNEEKTRLCKVPEGEFDFLGHTFGRMHSARTGRAYLGTGHRRRALGAWSRISTRRRPEWGNSGYLYNNYVSLYG